MSVAGRKRGKGQRAAKGQPMPDFVPPCLATLRDAPPEGAEWLHEIKFDGYRLQACIGDGEARLLTRTGLDWTPRFRVIARALARLTGVQSAAIDGEVVVEKENGVSSFTALVDALEAGQSEAMRFVAFDLLYLNGVDVRDAPLSERKSLLAALLAKRCPPHITLSAHIEGSGADVLKSACGLGLEGIISKRADLPYRSGRRLDWVKSKCILTDELVVGGFVVSSVDPKAIGALVLGTFERKHLVYAGRVGTGFTQKTARALWDVLKPLQRATPAFSTPLTAAQRRGVVWVRPELVAQVEYRARTGDGLLRHASFKGLREDKPARSVRRPPSP